MPGPQPYGKRLPAGAYRTRPYVEIDIPRRGGFYIHPPAAGVAYSVISGSPVGSAAGAGSSGTVGSGAGSGSGSGAGRAGRVSVFV